MNHARQRRRAATDLRVRSAAPQRHEGASPRSTTSHRPLSLSSLGPCTLGALLAVAATVGIAGGLAGCESQEKYDASGPPPEGYATWDDYFEAQDQLQRDLEATKRGTEMDRTIPGVPVGR